MPTSNAHPAVLQQPGHTELGGCRLRAEDRSIKQHHAASVSGKASPSRWCWRWHLSPLHLTQSLPPGSACACWAGCHLRASWRAPLCSPWTGQAVQLALASPSWSSCCCGRCKRCGLHVAGRRLPPAMRATAGGQAAAAAGTLDLQKAGHGPRSVCWQHVIRLQARQSGHQGSGKASRTPCLHLHPAPAGPYLRPQHSLQHARRRQLPTATCAQGAHQPSLHADLKSRRVGLPSRGAGPAPGGHPRCQRDCRQSRHPPSCRLPVADQRRAPPRGPAWSAMPPSLSCSITHACWMRLHGSSPHDADLPDVT